MSKSICIKTNNMVAVQYLIHELDNLDLDDVYYSCKSFRNYTNVIVHYKGLSICSFFSTISRILSYLVLDLYEQSLLHHLISTEYFYFSKSEQESIFNTCLNTLNINEEIISRLKFIEPAFYDYLNNFKNINLFGFINFRLFTYIKYLDSIIDMCVNKFIVDKEYLEYVSVLKSYVNSSIKSSSTVHLVYKNGNSILLDSNQKIINANMDIFKVHFLSDISFSSNDYTLNSLLTLLPNKLFIHLIDEEDEFINTLKLIFDSCIHICTNCDLCSYYKKANLNNKIY